MTATTEEAPATAADVARDALVPSTRSVHDGAVTVIDNAFPDALATELFNTLHLYGWTYGWLSNHMLEGIYGHWNRTYAGANKDSRDDAFPDIRVPAIRRAWEHLKSLLPPEATVIRCYSNAHTYGVEGYVHQDSARPTDLTAILYLNKDWDANDAGELVFLDRYEGGEVTAAVLPKWNRLVIFPGTVPHAARSLSRRCKQARICLVFKTKAE